MLDPVDAAKLAREKVDLDDKIKELSAEVKELKDRRNQILDVMIDEALEETGTLFDKPEESE